MRNAREPPRSKQRGRQRSWRSFEWAVRAPGWPPKTSTVGNRRRSLGGIFGKKGLGERGLRWTSARRKIFCGLLEVQPRRAENEFSRRTGLAKPGNDIGFEGPAWGCAWTTRRQAIAGPEGVNPPTPITRPGANSLQHGGLRPRTARGQVEMRFSHASSGLTFFRGTYAHQLQGKSGGGDQAISSIPARRFRLKQALRRGKSFS